VVLRDGRTQQIGTPEEVYGRPANRYVAGFMGYRTMLDARVVATDGTRAQLEIAGTRLTGLDRDGAGVGASVTAAVRPEDIDVTTGPDGLAARVEVVEYHGRELAVRAVLPDGQLVHFRTRERLAPDDAVHLAAPADRVLVFTADEDRTAVAADDEPAVTAR
jgi:putative spermidine/putrescine transport system ATP-binding protein